MNESNLPPPLVVTKGAQSTNTTDVLGSLWDGLNSHLIASVFEVDHQGFPVGRTIVRMAPTEFNLEQALNWQSPFENAGAEGLSPSMMNMLQSGAITPVLNSLAGLLDSTLGEGAGDSARKMGGRVGEVRGRTGMTKLNSVQVFTGAAPLKFQGQFILRAWRDPVAEVEKPLEQLMQWALPKYLAPEGTMLSGAMDFAAGKKDLGEAILPSEAPTLIGIKYKGRVYAPLVIENIGLDLCSPVDNKGNFVQLQLPITFASLVAWDRHDWKYAKLK
ncbi:hypothetical protein [Ectopseudomonas oleovorans]|nr:hypothetical protein [Pseudomonas oleovorans]